MHLDVGQTRTLHLSSKLLGKHIHFKEITFVLFFLGSTHLCSGLIHGFVLKDDSWLESNIDQMLYRDLDSAGCMQGKGLNCCNISYVIISYDN